MKLQAVILGAAMLFVAGCTDSDLEQRQAEIAEAGKLVMPFNLDLTTHVFEQLPRGGLQSVLSDDGNAEQITLIRAHLAEEAERFARGDFHDPAMIHGDDMAGLHTLVMGHQKMTITYREVEQGAEILYDSEDPEMVEAIHQWFGAQVMDHGEHAQGHM